MKKNYFFSLWLRAFSCTTTMTMLFTALMALMTNTTKTFAQTSNTKYGVVNNIDDLVGIDPSDDYLSRTGTAMPPDNKLLFFYNVGAKRFLSPGGRYGTQASLDNSAYPLWLNEPSGTSDYFNIVNNLGGSGSGTFLGIGTQGDTENLYMDQIRCNFVFEKAPDYTDKNKVYYVKVVDNGKYFQANPNDNPNNHTLNTTKLTKDDAGYKYQEWKIITKKEYYELVNANPANMEDVIDFSFIIKTPSFRVNNTEVKNWKATAETDKIFFGDNKQYRIFDKRDATNGTSDWGGTYLASH